MDVLGSQYIVGEVTLNPFVCLALLVVIPDDAGCGGESRAILLFLF
jgi:hypothetical protein